MRQCFPSCFTLQVALERPQISQRDLSSPTFFWVMLLWSGCDASAVSATGLWKPYGAGMLLRPAAVTCRHPREAGWSGQKSCKPPALADPLRNFQGRWNLLFILWPAQEPLVWRWDGEMNMDSFHCEKREKKISPVVGNFLNNKTFHLKYSFVRTCYPEGRSNKALFSGLLFLREIEVTWEQ